MRIAVVLNTSWNIYNFRMNLVRKLLHEGHEVHTIAPRDHFTHFLEEEGCIHHNVRMDSRGANPLKDSALIVELFFIYKRIRPDIVLHYTIKPNVYGTLAAALLRIPVINNVCGLGTVFLKENLVSAIAILLYKVSFRFAHKVFFQNPEDLKLFIRKKMVRPSAVDLIPGSGIDLEKFQPVAFRRNETFTFLLISRLITDKGILDYIDAIRKLRGEGINARFQILGAMDPEHKRGIKVSFIRDWIESDTIEYLGTTIDVRTFIERADCVVLPSYREGTPHTLLEAASSAKPIITTDVPGCNHVVVNNFNGLLCRMKDPADLAAKMKELSLCPDEKLQTFGRNGRLKMEAEYDENLVINKYLRALNSFKRAS
ncbi:MAG TPA: glycosyltransferase family 4 protein [Chryseosolibacter sp.]|nr:glycosyltransferase family 4 protein [Chryseosolibacter sp.]